MSPGAPSDHSPVGHRGAPPKGAAQTRAAFSITIGMVMWTRNLKRK